jgi:hypothetical protein
MNMGPTKMKRILEGLARTVEALLHELQRRSAHVDVDMTDYEEYRDACPRQDA